MTTTYRVLYIKSDPYGYWNPNTTGKGQGRAVTVRQRDYIFTAADLAAFGYIERELTAEEHGDLVANRRRIDVTAPAGVLAAVAQADWRE